MERFFQPTELYLTRVCVFHDCYTVDGRDITAATDIGRAFMTFFIVAGIAYFAFFLPNLVNTVMDRYQHTRWKKFYFTRVAHHVIVCGPLTAGVVSDFLKQFLLHQDMENQKTHVLLLHTDQSDQKLRSVLRSHYYRVQYLIGSALNAEDLERAKLSECLEVFILARKQCQSPEREDEENLLRLLSIKSAARKVPVTIQVLLSSSKTKVKDIPHRTLWCVFRRYVWDFWQELAHVRASRRL